MFSLRDLLGEQQGSEAVDQISQSVGADQSSVSTAIQAALPMLVNGLANNASTPQGAESLNNALEQDHNGSILDNLGGLGSMIFGQQAAPTRQADAGGILGHILGGSQGQVAQEVSNRSGLSMGQTAQILMMLAPIVMGYLGRQKQQQGVDAGGSAVCWAVFWADPSRKLRCPRARRQAADRSWTGTATEAQSTISRRWRSITSATAANNRNPRVSSPRVSSPHVSKGSTSSKDDVEPLLTCGLATHLLGR